MKLVDLVFLHSKEEEIISFKRFTKYNINVFLHDFK